MRGAESRFVVFFFNHTVKQTNNFIASKAVVSFI